MLLLFQEAVEENAAHDYCSCFGGKGPIATALSLPQTSFSNGERIVLSGEAANRSGVDAGAVYVALQLVVSYDVKGERKRDKKTAAIEWLGPLPAGQTMSLDSTALTVPEEDAAPPAQWFEQCALMKFQYFLEVREIQCLIQPR